uniref:protein-tyrosine-phosphatase n=1 Tax=Albugo laibachii Nc14 TaxID=890382 RepID=F0W813_9STRA|nr:dual specificity protein phosphatase putative [Albugo laibachii Nc14]|eukprot:CCA17266.1 dual specificity protein phosphatase putative [Albugo laibachii Nc14]
MALHNDGIEFLPGRLWYVSLKQTPTPTNGVHFFSIDHELVYWNFYLDFGPLNLGQTFVFSEMLNEKLKNAAKKKEKLVLYSSTQGQQRANTVCILGCWGVLYQNMTAEKAFEPFRAMRFPSFHDATPSACLFNLSILDCLQGLEKAIQRRYVSTQTFQLREYQHYEQVENGDLTWVSPKFIAFAGPHQQYSRTPQGHVMLTPEQYIPYFKAKNVTLVVRLNEKQYDENRFIDAGIEHLDLIYPDGTNAPIPILLKFIEACEKTSGAVAVHCKAGLGRTGTCIGAYMMKHDLFTAHQLIGWLRLCRPGSVIGPQQQFLESIQSVMWASYPSSWPIAPGNSTRLMSEAIKQPKLASLRPVVVKPVNVTGLLPIRVNGKTYTSMGTSDRMQGEKLNDQKLMRRLSVTKVPTI